MTKLFTTKQTTQENLICHILKEHKLNQPAKYYMTTFKQWLLTEEIDRNGKTAIVYHRTKKIENAIGILQYGSKSDFHKDHPMLSDFDKKYQPTSMFFVFDLESTMGKAGTYGNAIIKFKVTDLDKYLVFHTNMAKRIHGDNYKLSDQLREFKISQNFTKIHTKLS
jgi:hypothetical protein